jgi:hypothetical protein
MVVTRNCQKEPGLSHYFSFYLIALKKSVGHTSPIGDNTR